MKAFTFKGELYLRVIPGKSLFHSTMVHEVVNRGDIFAVNLSTQTLTIIPGSAQVEHLEVKLADAPPKEDSIAHLRAVAASLRAELR